MGDFEFSKEMLDESFVRASSRVWNELGIKLKKVQYFKPSFDFKKYEGITHIDREFQSLDFFKKIYKNIYTGP